MSVVFLRQREATSLAVALANDIATAALDEDHFRGTGEYRIDPELARQYGLELSAASDLADHLPTVEVDVIRSEERRVGKECVSKCRSRCSRYHKTKNKYKRHITQHTKSFKTRPQNNK